jgi:dihydromethanopterin reductase (acceptor)
MSETLRKPRLAWALTGSGHYFTECLALIGGIPDLDLFVTKAAAEVVRMYKQDLAALLEGARIFRDTTASAGPVGHCYHGVYHTLVLAPATSNTVAKCVAGISDSLATNVYAQAGKCRVPSIVFACDTAPEMETESPHGMVKVFPRRIDLENVERLKGFEATEVVESLADLERALAARLATLQRVADERPARRRGGARG